MNAEPMRIFVEASGVRGAARSVLVFLASQAEVCIATASLNQIMAFTKYSKSHALRAVHTLRRTGNAEWLEGSEAFADNGARRYHLPKACGVGSDCEKISTQQASVPSGSYSQGAPAVSIRAEWGTAGGTPRQIPLLPEILREIHQAKSEGREPPWEFVRTAQSERYFLEECRARARLYEVDGVREAIEQRAFDWDDAMRQTQIEELLLKFPELRVKLKPEPPSAPPSNVVEIRRKSA